MRRVFLCAILLAGCHRAPLPLSVFHVQVAAGPELRRAGDWRDRVAGRVRAVSAMFQPAGVQLDLATVSEWEPDPKLSLEANRRILTGYHSSGGWIDLGIYGSDQTGEPGVDVPFDSRALVFETPGADEGQQAANMAHIIAHVLGAWHTRTGGSVMSLPPGRTLDDTAAGCLRLTRSVDLRQGPSGLDDVTVEGLQKLWAASGQPAGDNPLYRAYADLGSQQMASGQTGPAEQDFTLAEKFGPGLASTHLELGNAALANHEYLEATDELRKALQMNPGSSSAMGGLAVALIATGHRDEGIDTFAKSVKMNPGNAQAHANYGLVLLSFPGRRAEAIAELREALRIDPGNDSLKKTLDVALTGRQPGPR